MNYNKKIYVLIIFLSLISFNGKSYADDIHKNLVQIINHGDKMMYEDMRNNLTNYDQWWKSLSMQQKRIARAVDKKEKEYKNNHNQLPIEFTEANVAEISNQVGVVNSLDIEVVEKRVKQHIEDYNNIIRAQELSKNIDKTKAIINGVYD